MHLLHFESASFAAAVDGPLDGDIDGVGEVVMIITPAMLPLTVDSDSDRE